MTPSQLTIKARAVIMVAPNPPSKSVGDRLDVEIKGVPFLSFPGTEPRLFKLTSLSQIVSKIERSKFFMSLNPSIR